MTGVDTLQLCKEWFNPKNSIFSTKTMNTPYLGFSCKADAASDCPYTNLSLILYRLQHSAGNSFGRNFFNFVLSPCFLLNCQNQLRTFRKFGANPV